MCVCVCFVCLCVWVCRCDWQKREQLFTVLTLFFENLATDGLHSI